MSASNRHGAIVLLDWTSLLIQFGRIADALEAGAGTGALGAIAGEQRARSKRPAGVGIQQINPMTAAYCARDIRPTLKRPGFASITAEGAEDGTRSRHVQDDFQPFAVSRPAPGFLERVQRQPAFKMAIEVQTFGKRSIAASKSAAVLPTDPITVLSWAATASNEKFLFAVGQPEQQNYDIRAAGCEAPLNRARRDHR